MLKFLVKLAGAVMILAAIASCKKNENQDFGIANIGASTESVTFTKDGGEQTIRILSTRDWTAEITSTDGEVDWLVVSPASGAPSTDSVSVVFTAVPNSNEDRYATVTFKAGAVSATVSVSQPGEIARQYDAIADVRALYNGENVTITEDWTICGTVISNYRHAKSGGLNNATSQKTMVIQDETAGITLYLAENNTDFALGDKVEVKVKDLTLQRYQNGSLQINAVPLDRVTKLTSGQQVEAKTISASELVTGEYESQYVAVTDVQVNDADLGKTFVEYGPADSSHRSINFIARTGERFVLFSSAYSTFGKETVPEGSGTLKGIAAVYGGGTYQISITSTDDYAGLTGERFDEGEIPVISETTGNYNAWNAVGPLASFSDDFESITEKNQRYENDNWMFYTSDGSDITTGFKTEIFDKDGTKYISIAPFKSSADQVVAYALPPRADITKADPKTFTFRKALYYKDNGDDSKLEVVVSSNFTGNFETATWTVIKDCTIPNDSKLNVYSEETVDLSAYSSASSLAIAIRYTGKSNTYRIDDVAFGNGENQGGGDEPEPDELVDIADVRALYSGSNVTINSGWAIRGTVISNLELNNGSSLKNVIIQDETAGIMIRFDSDNTEFLSGDVLEINIEGQSLQMFNGLLQLNNVPIENATEIDQGTLPEAKVISAAQLLTGDYESQYVAVENVQVVESDLGKTWVTGGNNTSITIESATGETFVVYSARYSDALVEATVPEGSGTLKGIAQRYNSTIQIMLASTNDYAGLTGARFDGSEPDPDPQPGEPKKVTIAEFLKAEVDDTVWYQLTGTISNITNASYGNFDLTDETGTVYVWGLTAEKVSSNDKSFSSIGLKEGDIVTLVGTRTEHNGTAQVGGPAYYITHKEGETPDVPEGDPTALIISEYVEGSSFNKYIEIANISDKTVNLASYALVLYSNGKTSPESTVALEGTLEPGAVKVYKHADAALTLPEGVDSESNTAVNFSGDDAIVLTCNGENADVVGYIGEKIEWGKDKTFRRKTTVTAPTTEFNIDEWEQSSKDDVSGLGSF